MRFVSALSRTSANIVCAEKIFFKDNVFLLFMSIPLRCVSTGYSLPAESDAISEEIRLLTANTIHSCWRYCKNPSASLKQRLHWSKKYELRERVKTNNSFPFKRVFVGRGAKEACHTLCGSVNCKVYFTIIYIDITCHTHGHTFQCDKSNVDFPSEKKRKREIESPAVGRSRLTRLWFTIAIPAARGVVRSVYRRMSPEIVTGVKYILRNTGQYPYHNLYRCIYVIAGN